MHSSFHIGSIVGERYKYVGIGCSYYDTTSWVVLVYDKPLATEAENAKIKTSGSAVVNRTFDFNISHEEVDPTTFTRRPRSIDYGNMNDKYLFRIKDIGEFHDGYAPPADMLEFSVADPSILTVDPATGRILPHKVGTTDVAVTLKGHP